MIVNVLPSIDLDISKYLDRHGVHVHEDIRKDIKFKGKCAHGVFCPVENELVMLKEFLRDDDLFHKIQMDIINENIILFENSHITNMVNCKFSNKKLFKYYFQEFKKRKKNWIYSAIIFKKRNMAKNKKEQKMLDEMQSILKQCGIKCYVINNYKNVTLLKKEILRQINVIKNRKNNELRIEDQNASH